MDLSQQPVSLSCQNVNHFPPSSKTNHFVRQADDTRRNLNG